MLPIIIIITLHLCSYRLTAVAFEKSRIPTDTFLDIDGISISPSILHVCVLTAQDDVEIGGKLRCWGNSPRQMKLYESNNTYVQVASGMDFVCAIKVDQTVDCFGSISSAVPGLFSQISAADHHACGVLTNGALYCWGFKYFDVPSHFKNEIFVQVSCSKRHCCAIDAYAYVHCFGDRNEIREEMIAPKHVNGKQSQSRSRPREEIGVYFDGEDENDNEYQTNDIKQTIHSISSLKKEAKIDVEEDGYDEYADEDEIEKEENEERELNNLLNLADSIGDNIESLSAETAAAMKAAVAARDAKEELRLQEIKEKELFNDLEILNRNRAGYIQFKQISVGDDYSCGITLDYNNLLCWGSEGKHDDMPRNITGPIKQVSVSKQGVCVIYDNKENDMFWRVTGKLQCWGAAVSKVPSSMMLSSISVSVSSDGSVENIPITSNNLDNTSNERWLQVKVGCGNMVCAVNDQSSLHCWGGQHVSGMQPPANLMIM